MDLKNYNNMKIGSKVLLFGEYTVLNNGVALTVPFDKFSGTLCFPKNGEKNSSSEKSNDVVKRFSDFMAHLPEKDLEGMDFRTLYDEVKRGIFFKSNIPQGYGLGSSGALVVAVFVRYFQTTRELTSDIKGISKENLNRMKRVLGKLESFFHGSSSGIDPLSIFVNEPLLFQSSEVQKVDLPAYNSDGKNTIFLLDTGKERNTKQLVNIFNEKMECSKFQSAMKDELVEYSNNCISALIENETDSLYDNLSKLVQCQLSHLDHLIPNELKDKVSKGIESKDYFIKICGAGGGGYLLGFTSEWEKTQKEFEDYQLEILHKF